MGESAWAACPVWVTLRDHVQQLAERYPTAVDLFGSLREYGEHRIAEDEADDNPEE